VEAGETGAGKRCAFLTMEDRGDFVIDDDLALQPMAEMD
jgi:RNase adaptor protein for sRNA GlmZ degradation